MYHYKIRLLTEECLTSFGGVVGTRIVGRGDVYERSISRRVVWTTMVSSSDEDEMLRRSTSGSSSSSDDPPPRWTPTAYVYRPNNRGGRRRFFVPESLRARPQAHHWVTALRALETVKENIPEGCYIELVKFAQTSWRSSLEILEV